MDDHLLLEILDGQRDLPEVIPRFDFSDPLATFNEFVEGLDDGWET